MGETLRVIIAIGAITAISEFMMPKSNLKKQLSIISGLVFLAVMFEIIIKIFVR